MYVLSVFTVCGPGKYHAHGRPPCKKCPRDTYQDSQGKRSCIPCPYSGKTHSEGAKSIEQCLVYFGNFDVNHTNRNLNGLSEIQLYQSNSLLNVNGTVIGWNVEVTGNGTAHLMIAKLNPFPQ